MKLSEINLNRELIARFLKKRWPVVLSLAVLIGFFGAAIWSLLFISHAINKAFRVDEKKISTKIPKINIDSYNRLKDKWKDFQNGKYIGTTNVVSQNQNSNSSNANVSGTNANDNSNDSNVNAQ